MAATFRNTTSLRGVERMARIGMSGVAILAAGVALSFKAGLISTAPAYDRQSWYLVSEHAGVIVTREVDDEAACRKREKAPSVCRSGSSLADAGMPAQRR